MAAESPRKQSRRQQVLDAAESVFAVDGFEKATVRRVADAAGILSGSLYHHFRSKDEMAIEVLDRFMSQMLDRYREAVGEGQPADRTMAALVEIGVCGIGEHHQAAVMMNNDWPALRWSEGFARLDRLARDIEHVWVSVIEEGISSGLFRADIDAQVGYRAMVGGVLSTVRWYRPDGPIGIEQIARQYVQLFLGGYRVP